MKEVVEIIIAFAAAWIFYQGLGYAAGTATPIVSVASGSMLHANGFEYWWTGHGAYYESVGTSKQEFQTFQNSNGLDIGDILFVVDTKEIEAGDIIIYRPDPGCFKPDVSTIVHRVVQISEGRYMTKGDNNAGPDQCRVSSDQVEGKAVIAVPLLGYPRLVIEPFVQKLG